VTKKRILALICLLLLLPALSINAGGVDSPFVPINPNTITANAAMLVNARTGEVYFEKNPDGQVYPASTTKIMTALLALEHTDDFLQQVTCSDAVADIDYTSTVLGVKPGEILPLQELLYGLMLPSGNDCAMAIAVFVSGSVSDFVELMNKRAKELGMLNTGYTNPHGLHNTAHYTTARDMAILTREAMKLEAFREIVGSSKHTFPATNKSDRMTKYNSNYLINPEKEQFFYPGCNGVKTGYTSNSGGCLIASSLRNDTEFIALIFGDDQNLGKWSTATTMFNFGYSNYTTLEITGRLSTAPILTTIKNAARDDLLSGELQLTHADCDPIFITGKNAEMAAYELQLKDVQMEFSPALDTLRAPIESGQVLGQVRYTLDGEELWTSSLVASRSITERRGIFQPLINFTSNLRVPLWGLPPLQYYSAIIGIICIIGLLVIGLGMLRKRRQKQSARRVTYNLKPKPRKKL